MIYLFYFITQQAFKAIVTSVYGKILKDKL